MVLEGGPHAFGLLRWRVGLLVPVQVIGVVLVAACDGREQGGGSESEGKKHSSRFISLKCCTTRFVSAALI